MADHLELVAEIPKVEKLTVQDRLELAKKRRSQQLKRWDREKDEEFGPPPPKKRPQRAKPVKFEPRIILLEAASRGDYDEVKKMLDYGVDPNLANDDGLTSLHQACIDECEDIAELLVGYGADIDAEDRELWTPLHASAACENFAMVQYLIENGANVAAINSDGNLPVDLVEEDEELRKYLHDEMNKHGFNQDKVDELIMLREKRMLEDIKDAIEKRRDLEIKDKQGATALHVAAANAYVEVLEFLLENDADIEVVDKDGWKPIHAAACWGNEKAIELLVEHGADLESRTPYGETPLDLCEDADTRQFIIDLKNKMKTNKFKVKNNRRKRNNSRSLSVKRSSLKEKISISQNEAKAEAILRQHPELAFLITKDKKTTDEPNQVDLSVEQNNFTPKEESPSPVRTQTEEKKIEHTNTQITEIPMSKKYERTSKVEEKSTTKIVDIKVVERGGNEKENRPLENANILKGERPLREPVTKEIDAAPKVQGITSTNIQYKSKTETRQHVSQEKKTPRLSEKIEPPSCPPPRSPTAGHRQLPADPRGQQTTKENSTIKTSHTSREVTVTKQQRTPATKPLSELSSNSNTTSQSVTTAPKSSKTRAAPPVPQSSGSTSGRSPVPSSDTSGYPESFSNRKSRDSRELTETSLQQLTKAKDIKESKVVSPSDVTLSSQAVTAKYTSKPTIPPSSLPSTQPSDTAAILDVSSETAPTTKTPVTNNIRNSTVEEPRKKFKQPTDAEQVGRHKKSCCVLM